MYLTLYECWQKGYHFPLKELLWKRLDHRLVFDTEKRQLVPISGSNQSTLEVGLDILRHMGVCDSEEYDSILRTLIRIRGCLNLGQSELLRMQLKDKFSLPKICYLLNIATKSKSPGFQSELSTVYGTKFSHVFLALLHPVDCMRISVKQAKLILSEADPSRPVLKGKIKLHREGCIVRGFFMSYIVFACNSEWLFFEENVSERDRQILRNKYKPNHYRTVFLSLLNKNVVLHRQCSV